MATPLALDAYGMRAALGKTAGIEGDDAIGLPQAFGHLANQHGDQRAMIPRDGTDEVLDDLSLNIDERRNVLSIFAGQVRQQPLEVEVHVALAGLGLQRVLGIFAYPPGKIYSTVQRRASLITDWSIPIEFIGMSPERPA